MKKILLLMAFAMSFSCAFAQFGQLNGSGSEKQSKKVDKQSLVNKEKAKKGIETPSSGSGPENISFYNINYRASFEYFDMGSYGLDYDFLCPDGVIGGTFGFHTNAGLTDGDASLEYAAGLTFTTALTDKVYLYAPFRLHYFMEPSSAVGLSLTPSLAFRSSDKIGFTAGLPIMKAFTEGSKVEVGLSLGLFITL